MKVKFFHAVTWQNFNLNNKDDIKKIKQESKDGIT